MPEPLNPAGAGQDPDAFKKYRPDLAVITKDNMYDVYEYGGPDLMNLVLRAVRRSIDSDGELKWKFTPGERDCLRSFSRRGEDHFRWTPPPVTTPANDADIYPHD